MTFSDATKDTLDGATVYVSAVQRHLEAVDNSVTGVVQSIDAVGVLLVVTSSSYGAAGTDAGRTYFIPWTSIERVVMQELGERPTVVDSTRPLPHQ